MKSANRFDTYTAGEVERLDNGFLRAPVFATRAGIFTYQLPDGTFRRELRSEAEVFKADSLKTMRSIPVTNRHPSELVDSKNVKKYMVGATSDSVSRRDEFIETFVTLMDENTIDEVDKRGLRQVSCGYRCDVVHEPGEFNGERYDAVQKNIRYNHLALVSKGRAGEQVKLRLDSDDAVMIDSNGESPANDPNYKPDGGNKGMSKVTVNGVQYDASEALAAAVTSEFQKKDEALANANKALEAANSNAKKEKDGLQAKLDQAIEERNTLKKDAENRPELAEAVKARMALVQAAMPHLDEKTVSAIQEMDERAIKVAVIKSKAAKFDDEGKSDDYIAARFDAIIETAPEKKKTDEPNSLIKNLSKVDDTRGGEKTAEQVRADALKETQSAWQKPLSATVRSVAN